MTQELLKLITAVGSSFAIAREPDLIRVGVSGRILTGNRDALKGLVLDQLERGDRVFVLDCTRCDWIDAVGWGCLVSINNHVKRRGGTFAIEGLNEDLRTFVRDQKLDDVLTITPATAKEEKRD